MERVLDAGRRLRRAAEQRRRVLLVAAAAVLLLLYAAPQPLLRAVGLGARQPPGPAQRCVAQRLEPWADSLAALDAALLQDASADLLAPYVGNGRLALVAKPGQRVRARRGRVLGLSLPLRPVHALGPAQPHRQVAVVDYRSGVLHVHRCFERGHRAAFQYYAHRTIPALLVQEIRLTNPTDASVEITLSSLDASEWPSAAAEKTIRLRRGDSSEEYVVHTGSVDAPGESDSVIAIASVSRVLPTLSTLKAGETVEYESFTAIEYSEPIPRVEYDREIAAIEGLATESIRRAIEKAESPSPAERLKEVHAAAWADLWRTGFSISESKAADAINGDAINATIYAVLSQVRSLEREEATSPVRRAEIKRALAHAEGCYEGHHTLRAGNLWRPLLSARQIDEVVGAWLLTLEKQGCRNLLKAGAAGVAQAMVLSFGSFRFSDQHLEFNMHPSDLHRDFEFRRINYGNLTRVNVSVVVREDNTAVMYVTLDKADRKYFACDAGCLDEPAPLWLSRKFFPVKLTDPPTAILYIAPDREHIEDLRHAIHVKEVAVAPAHEHHVIALHRHGGGLGGLSTMFWVAICIIIVAFHAFLCRIIMSEYCDPPDKYRRSYGKP